MLPDEYLDKFKDIITIIRKRDLSDFEYLNEYSNYYFYFKFEYDIFYYDILHNELLSYGYIQISKPLFETHKIISYSSPNTYYYHDIDLIPEDYIKAFNLYIEDFYKKIKEKLES